MKAFKNTFRCLAVMLLVLVAGSCQDYGSVTIDSCSLVSVRPQGLKSIDVVLEAGISNPLSEFDVMGLSGVLKMDGVPYLNVTADDITIMKKSDEKYLLNLHGTICDNVGIMQVLSLAGSFDPDKLTYDASCTLKHWTGIKIKKEYKDKKL